MQQNDNFRLAVRRGPQPNQTFEINQEVTTLGRDISNDIVINDRETSRHHLRLTRSDDGLTIEDLGSTNGTFVNGKRISGITPLQNGDMIGLGETVTLALEIHQPLQEATAMPAEPTPPPADPLPPVDPPAPVPSYTPPPTEYGLQDAPPAPAPAAVDPYAPANAEALPQAPPADYYAQPPTGYATPPPPQQYAGYDYDPYAVRDEGGGTSPWLILGCFVFFVLVMVCFAGIALVIIDVLNLWCELPVISDVVRALGLGC